MLRHLLNRKKPAIPERAPVRAYLVFFCGVFSMALVCAAAMLFICDQFRIQYRTALATALAALFLTGFTLDGIGLTCGTYAERVLDCLLHRHGSKPVRTLLLGMLAEVISLVVASVPTGIAIIVRPHGSALAAVCRWV